MMSLSVTNLSSTATNATDRVAKVGDLRKHAEVLKQQLQQAKTPGTSPEDKTKANSLSQEIINIQSQIDRLILEGQLSKLTTGVHNTAQTEPPSDATEASGDKPSRERPQDDKEANAPRHAAVHFQAQENKKFSPYQLDLEQGLLIDVKA
jgi:hypothetical protein